MKTLAKGVKKFPAGGANRWDAIAQYINNVCRSEEPRTKEECIEVFKKYKATRNGTEPVTPAAPPNLPRLPQQRTRPMAGPRNKINFSKRL